MAELAKELKETWPPAHYLSYAPQILNLVCPLKNWWVLRCYALSSGFCKTYQFYFRFAENPESEAPPLISTALIGKEMLVCCIHWVKGMSFWKRAKGAEEEGVGKGDEASVFTNRKVGFAWQLGQASFAASTDAHPLHRLAEGTRGEEQAWSHREKLVLHLQLNFLASQRSGVQEVETSKAGRLFTSLLLCQGAS